MGYNLRLFAETCSPYYYGDTKPIRLELEECIHFHVGQHRFMWTTDEFQRICTLFSTALSRLKDIGLPNQSDKMCLLAGQYLPSHGLQSNRWALELTKGDQSQVHIHLGEYRFHMPLIDFGYLCGMFKEAQQDMCLTMPTIVDLKSNNIILPAHVKIQYLPLLEGYYGKYHLGQDIRCSLRRVLPEEIGKLQYLVKRSIAHSAGEDIQ